MKYDFTYSNLNIIKTDYSNKSNHILLGAIINFLMEIDFKKIELKNSLIEIFENTKYGTGINFNLISKSSISINLNISENYIDLVVSDNITIYEMYQVKNSVEFLIDLKKWFDDIVIESAYVKLGFIFVNKFENSKGDILFKKANYFYSNHFNRNYYQNKYDAWIIKPDS